MTQDQTPSLRFPEFRGKDPWEAKRLGEVCDLQDGYAFSPKNFTNSAIDAIQVIRITDINNKNKNADKVYVHASLVKILKLDKYMVQEGDLLLSLTGAAGFNFFFWNSKPALINQRTMKIMAKEKLNTTLLKLLEPLIHTEINSHGTGQNNNVSKETLKHTLSFLPKPDEQQKIAACLSSLDEVITIHGDRLDGLKDYKRGLMQQLFPADGQTTPTLRFPEFQGTGAWEMKQMGEVFTRITAKNTENNQNSLTISAQDGLVNQLNYFNKKISAKDLSGYYLLQKDDFAYNKSYSKGYPMGAFKRLKLYSKGVISTLYICFRVNPEYSKSFFEYYFDCGMLNNEISKIAQEGARNHGLLNISVKDFFEKISVIFPNISEQKKIADCLSAMDELITAQEQKIKTLKHHKNGLMQQLFPKL